MQHSSNINSLAGQPGHDPERNEYHCAATLAYLRSLPRNLTDRECPSTVEITHDGRFGLRPPNRINDLIHGKHDGRRYDFQKIKFGRGEYHWRLHEPNRRGYPKDKRQSTLELETPKQEIPWNERKPLTGLELFDAAVR